MPKLSGKPLFPAADMYIHRDQLKFCATHSLGAVLELRWPSWAVRPNEPYGFCGCKAILNHAHALVSMSTDI